MDKTLNWISVTGGMLGGWIAGLLGGFDPLLQTLSVLVVLDYVSGFIKGIALGELSSEAGFRGIAKKCMVFMIIAAANAMQPVIPLPVPIRETVLLFFVANEGLSLLENAAVFIPIPNGLKEKLLQVREQTKVRAKNDGETKQETAEEDAG